MAEIWEKKGTKSVVDKDGKVTEEDVYEIKDTVVLRKVNRSYLLEEIAKSEQRKAGAQHQVDLYQAEIDTLNADLTELNKK